MGIGIDKFSKQRFIFFSIVLMLASLFTSRFLLSVGSILFLFFTCFHKHIIQQLISFFKNPFLLGISLLFFIPFVSFLWSEDKNMWMRFARIKLPLFLFPVAFAGKWQLSTKQWKYIAVVFIIVVFAGCCWSLWQYVQNMHTIHEQYLKAKLIPTPLENDHGRYSLVVAIAVICITLLIQKYKLETKWFLLLFAGIFFIVYLHILSARTGLISLYFFLAAYFFYLALKLRRTKWLIIFLMLVIIMPVAAWLLFPTFQNRIRYNLYDLSNIRDNKYISGSNDGNRILSLRAGWNVLQENPLGVGSDVVNKTYEWYDKNVPQTLRSERLFPSSEPLMYGGFAGWIGLILFFIIMALPFFVPLKTNYFFWSFLNLIMAASMLFDIGLEAQFGVFIYVFIVLWWWKWFGIFPENKASV